MPIVRPDQASRPRPLVNMGTNWAPSWLGSQVSTTWHPHFTVNDHFPSYGHLMLTAAVTRGYANYTPVVKGNDEALRTALTAQHHSPLPSSIRTEPPYAFHTGVHADNETPLPKGYPSQLCTSIRSPDLIPHQIALIKAHAKAESKPDSKGDRMPDYMGNQLPIGTTHAIECITAHITPDESPCELRFRHSAYFRAKDSSSMAQTQNLKE